MSLFTTIVTFGAGIAGFIVQMALAILALYVITKLTWVVIKNVWQIVHQKSYDSIMNKLEDRKVKKLEVSNKRVK
jgi:hypothetical protein